MNAIKLINFIDLTLDEKKMVLKWRNNPNVKQWMFTSNNISIQDHLNYIDLLKLKKDKIYFLVKNEDEYIGIIDFTNINFEKNEAELGLYSNPYLKGVGKILMEQVCNYGFEKLNLDKLISTVFKNNISAIRLYEKFNFRVVNKDKEVIYMELNNVNR